MKLLSMATMVISTLPLAAHAQNPCSPDDSLGARRSFVTTQMFDSGKTLPARSVVRLSQYSFRIMADGSCSVREDYWEWSHLNMAGSAYSGMSTDGCESVGQVCPVYTSSGFEKPPSTRFGRYVVGTNAVAVYWDETPTLYERWNISSLEKITKFTLSTSPRFNIGSGWGSKKGFGTFVPISLIPSISYPGSFYQNNYGKSVSGRTAITFKSFEKCLSGSCATLRSSFTYSTEVPESQIPATLNKYIGSQVVKIEGGVATIEYPEWNDNFIAGTGSRKNFYNHQMDQGADGAINSCIGVNGMGKGHLKPMLQIVDDDGAFRGWVGVEASLTLQLYGYAILGIFDLNNLQ